MVALPADGHKATVAPKARSMVSFFIILLHVLCFFRLRRKRFESPPLRSNEKPSNVSRAGSFGEMVFSVFMRSLHTWPSRARFPRRHPPPRTDAVGTDSS